MKLSIVLVYLSAIAVASNAAVPPRPAKRVHSGDWPADTMQFVGNSGRTSSATEIPDAPGLGGASIAIDPDPNDTTATLGFAVNTDYATARKGKIWARVYIRYKLRPGQRLPILGAIYSVADVSINPMCIKFARVTDAAVLNEIGVSSGSVAIPLDSDPVPFSFFENVSDRWDSSTLTLGRITARGPGGNDPTASLSLLNLVNGTGKPASNFELKTGDSISLLRGCKLTVKRIVPPDDKRKIIGWVEFFPNGESKGNK